MVVRMREGERGGEKEAKLEGTLEERKGGVMGYYEVLFEEGQVLFCFCFSFFFFIFIFIFILFLFLFYISFILNVEFYYYLLTFIPFSSI